MRSFRPARALLVGALTAAGCPAPAPHTAAQVGPAHLVVFPADADATKNPGLDGVAGALNRALEQALGGGSGVRVSPVNIADARAVVEECNASSSSEKCWAALASLNHADRVMVPELGLDAGAVSIALTLYDASAQRVVRTSQREYKSAREAEGGVKEQVATLAAAAGG